MHPFVAFELFCRKPATPTDEIDKMLFPPNEWAEILDNGDIRCNVKGEITQKGRAEWKDHESSCGHLLRCRDSYRRHLLHSHLGIRREDGKRQKEWIGINFLFMNSLILIYMQKSDGMRRCNMNRI